MILVTGASGVIGRVLMARLRLDDIEAIGVRREAFDLASGASLAAFIGRRPEAIVHLAAAVPHSTHYPDSEASATKTQAIDRTVYDAALEWGCRVVYASTCSLYDKHTATIKFEDTPVAVRPDSPYMQAKHKGEKMFAALISHIILRVPAPIGPGLPDTVVAKRFFKQAVAGQTIRVWGTGKREQNYVDICDVADMFLRAARSESIGVFNIAANAPTNMLELATAITRVVPRSSFDLVGVPDPLEQEYTRYSNARAREVLGWVPTVSLEDSIRSMYKVQHDAG
jgi:nucleoside-diphosphate-sugar epimerase